MESHLAGHSKATVATEVYISHFLLVYYNLDSKSAVSTGWA